MSNSKPQDPNTYSDPHIPLRNLDQIRTRIDSLHRFLSDSITSNSSFTHHQTAAISDQIAAEIHHTIANATALISHSRAFHPPRVVDLSAAPDLKTEPPEDEATGDEDGEIVEIDAVELLAEHIHFCEICGKGFRRDANLRMHMRAHGDQFKTAEALAKPDDSGAAALRRRFSCPFEGCNRNKLHGKFRALKSMVCVKNHFKRSHCPKMYSCNRCHKKSFSVLSDLKSHVKHCGESRWRCSCGTTFSRKDKLFGHIALFEGHMPAIAVEEEGKKKVVVVVEEEGDDGDEDEAVAMTESELGGCFLDDGLPDGFFDDLDDLSSLGFPVI